MITDDLLQVLEGLDPITEELGPYVYSATHVRRIIEVTLTLVCKLLHHTVTHFRWMKKLQIFSSRTKWCINFYQNYQQVDL